jgi:hypothetical protein
VENSLDVIRRYGELDQAKGFYREIVEARPISPRMDWLRLSCGHETEDSHVTVKLKSIPSTECR